MNGYVKKFIRTAQTECPYLLDFKFAVMRNYRRLRRIPFERDFEAIRLFPDDSNKVFLDVGANRGQSTEAILMMRRNCTVHQFEPNPLLCEGLRNRYKRDSRVITNAFGLANVSSEQTLYVPFYKKWMFDGLASFDAKSAGDWLKGRMYFYDDRHVSLRETLCRITRLDDLNLDPFFIKLDIQGYEFEALKGSRETLERNEPILLIESPPEDEIRSFLGEMGFQMFAYKEGRFFPGQIGRQNTYFMTKAKASLVGGYIAA